MTGARSDDNCNSLITDPLAARRDAKLVPLNQPRQVRDRSGSSQKRICRRASGWRTREQRAALTTLDEPLRDDIGISERD